MIRYAWNVKLLQILKAGEIFRSGPVELKWPKKN